MRKKVHPRYGGALRPRVPRSPAAGFSALSALALDGGLWRRGISSAQAPFAEHQRAIVDAPQPPERFADDPATLEREAVRAVLFTEGPAHVGYGSRDLGWPFDPLCDALAWRWSLAGSPAFALAVLVRASAMTLRNDGPVGVAVASPYVGPAPLAEGWQEGHLPPLWSCVRRCLAGGSAEQFAAARKVAEEARRDAPLALRCALSYALGAADLAREDLAEVVILPRAERAKLRYADDWAWSLFGALDDAADVERLLAAARDAGRGWVAAEWPATLLDAFQEGAVDLLIRALAGDTLVTAHAPYLEALAALADPRVARVFGARLGDRRDGVAAERYLRAHPELARAELPAIAADRRKRGTVARALLTELGVAPSETTRTPRSGRS